MPAGSAAQISVAVRMARTTCLVATGYLATNSRLPASMQQKYCDQGRSTAVLTMTWPICRVRRSCGSGGKARNASILPCSNSSIGFTLDSVIQWMFLGRVEPDQGCHQGHQLVRFQGLYPDTFSFQIGDGAGPFICEQLEAADHHSRQEGDRLAGIEHPDEVRRIVHVEIGFAVRDGLVIAGGAST